MNSDNDGPGRGETGNGVNASEPEDARLAELRRKIGEIKREPEREARARQTAGIAGVGQAVKVGSEFVAGVIVGFVIGYTIDKLFGTTPWGMILFLLLGFAAGTLNVMRATGVVAEKFPGDRGSGPDERKS